MTDEQACLQRMSAWGSQAALRHRLSWQCQNLAKHARSSLSADQKVLSHVQEVIAALGCPWLSDHIPGRLSPLPILYHGQAEALQAQLSQGSPHWSSLTP